MREPHAREKHAQDSSFIIHHSSFVICEASFAKRHLRSVICEAKNLKRLFTQQRTFPIFKT
ncbi:MAG TPA: hypothetical protein ENJ53_02555 [Phaeodactylibacter sp.]|nr:hypothetical protein [Phaeodactylibacter sp.]